MKANRRENSREKDHPLAIFMTISQETDERKETKKEKNPIFLDRNRKKAAKNKRKWEGNKKTPQSRHPQPINM